MIYVVAGLLGASFILSLVGTILAARFGLGIAPAAGSADEGLIPFAAPKSRWQQMGATVWLGAGLTLSTLAGLLALTL